MDDAAQALDVTAARLGDLVHRERSFTADASHQLRTPLTGLRLSLESALATPTADLRSAAEDAIGEVDRLQATVEDLLALARDADRERPVVELPTILEGLETRWHGPLAAAGRPLRVVCDTSLPSVRASASALGQVLDVLVDNAFRHGAGTVTVHARFAGGGVAVAVGDEGPGVRADPDGVFERHSASPDGHGIGLSLARSLSEAEGGRLLLERPGPAPVFLLILPPEADPE